MGAGGESRERMERERRMADEREASQKGEELKAIKEVRLDCRATNVFKKALGRKYVDKSHTLSVCVETAS